MKTQVIQLDHQDDVISVRDRMSWAKTPRLLLVFPRRGRILDRTLDLRLLKRHAASLGARLAFVTRSTEIKKLAEELDIPVFSNVETAQRRPWKDDGAAFTSTRVAHRPDLHRMHRDAYQAEAHWRRLPAVRLGFFSLAVLAVLGLLLLFVPSASVAIEPRTESQSLTFSLDSGPGITTIGLAGSLPAHTASLVVDGNQSAPATGSAEIPDQPAQGSVRFRNLTTSVVGIPSGTVVRTTGSPAVRFVTTSDGVAAAGVGKTVDLPVEAVEAGTTGNMPADALVAIEGNLGTSLAVINPEPTSGGTNRSTSISTAADRARLRESLLDDLREKALLQVPLTLDAGDVAFPDTLAVAQVLTETYIPAEGQPGDLVTLNLRIQFQIQFASATDLQSLAAEVMNASLPAGSELAAGSIKISTSGTPVTDSDGVTRWQATAVRSIRRRIDPLQSAQLISGKKVSEAGRILSENYPLESRPLIRIFPAWWPWLPWLQFRINTVIQ